MDDHTKTATIMTPADAGHSNPSAVITTDPWLTLVDGEHQPPPNPAQPVNVPEHVSVTMDIMAEFRTFFQHVYGGKYTVQDGRSRYHHDDWLREMTVRMVNGSLVINDYLVGLWGRGKLKDSRTHKFSSDGRTFERSSMKYQTIASGVLVSVDIASKTLVYHVVYHTVRGMPANAMTAVNIDRFIVHLNNWYVTVEEHKGIMKKHLKLGRYPEGYDEQQSSSCGSWCDC